MHSRLPVAFQQWERRSRAFPIEKTTNTQYTLCIFTAQLKHHVTTAHWMHRHLHHHDDIINTVITSGLFGFKTHTRNQKQTGKVQSSRVILHSHCWNTDYKRRPLELEMISNGLIACLNTLPVDSISSLSCAHAYQCKRTRHLPLPPPFVQEADSDPQTNAVCYTHQHTLDRLVLVDVETSNTHSILDFNFYY